MMDLRNLGPWNSVSMCPQTVDWLQGNINNRDILFKTVYGVWMLYNLDKQETEAVTLPVGTSGTFKHTESLVSIRGSELLSEMLAKLKMEDRVKQVRMPSWWWCWGISELVIVVFNDCTVMKHHIFLISFPLCLHSSL